jgi:hypothetical protein
VFLPGCDLPGNLWAEAIKAACIILNLRSILWFLGKTPFELFSSRKPNVANLHIFGSTAFVYDTKLDKSKLDSRSKKCLYLSHDDRTKGFQCFDIVTRRVLVSKNVRFIEDTTPVEIFSTPNPIDSSSPYMGRAATHDLPPIGSPRALEALLLATSLAPPSPVAPNVPNPTLSDPTISSPTPRNERNDPFIMLSLHERSPKAPVPDPTTSTSAIEAPPPVRRSSRIRQPPQSHEDYVKMDLD